MRIVKIWLLPLFAALVALPGCFGSDAEPLANDQAGEDAAADDRPASGPTRVLTINGVDCTDGQRTETVLDWTYTTQAPADSGETTYEFPANVARTSVRVEPGILAGTFTLEILGPDGKRLYLWETTGLVIEPAGVQGHFFAVINAGALDAHPEGTHTVRYDAVGAIVDYRLTVQASICP